MDNIQTVVNDVKKKIILLIEDEYPINDLYTRVFKTAGFDVLSTFDGIQGLAAAQSLPDLVLLDIMLPKMNGVEVLRHLKSLDITKHIPVVLLTNLGQADIVEAAFKIGAQGYLLKMRTDPDQLVEFARKYIADPNYKMDFNLLTLD